MSRRQRTGLGARVGQRRRGVVAVQVAVMITVLIGFAVLTIDVGAMYNTRGDLQRAADSAALASAALLSDYSNGDPQQNAQQAALDYTSKNYAFGTQVTLDPQADIIFGRANYDTDNNTYSFTPTTTAPDAVRIRVRRTADSPNGAMPLFFAGIFNKTHTDVAAEAIAMNVPRDISVVADLSASHTDDSEFVHYQITEINMWDTWDNLPGGIDDPATWPPGDPPPPYNPQFSGPTWGLYMETQGFGTQTVDSSYDPTADPGLVYLKYNTDWTNATIDLMLTQQGYNATEIAALNDNANDTSGAWKNRVATALGLTRWYSGIAGGLWETLGVPAASAGNGNANVADGEMSWGMSNAYAWGESIMGRSLSSSKALWVDWINNYMKSTSTSMYGANSNLRYRFGAKTFVNYLLENRSRNSQTPELAATPHQPMKAVKDAVGVLTSFVDGLDTDDQISLEIYGTTGNHEVDLTFDYAQVSDRLNEMQAGHYNGSTNMGAGIQMGINELTSANARPNARKIMFLLTDGKPNINSSGSYDEVGGAAWALDRASAAAAEGIKIYGAAVGADADPAFLTQVSDIGSGSTFYASGSIEEYSAQLQQIFIALGGKRPVVLIK